MSARRFEFPLVMASARGTAIAHLESEGWFLLEWRAANSITFGRDRFREIFGAAALQDADEAAADEAAQRAEDEHVHDNQHFDEEA